MSPYADELGIFYPNRYLTLIIGSVENVLFKGHKTFLSVKVTFY